VSRHRASPASETLRALIKHGSPPSAAERVRVPTPGVAGFETLKAPTLPSG